MDLMPALNRNSPEFLEWVRDELEEHCFCGPFSMISGCICQSYYICDQCDELLSFADEENSPFPHGCDDEDRY